MERLKRHARAKELVAAKEAAERERQEAYARVALLVRRGAFRQSAPTLALPPSLVPWPMVVTRASLRVEIAKAGCPLFAVC